MDLSGSSEVSPADVTTAPQEAPAKPVPSKAEGPVPSKAEGAKPAPSKAEKTRLSESKEATRKLYPVEIDHARDSLLTDFGKDTLQDRYLLPGESYQDLFVRVASAYADDAAHAQRLYDYVSKLWF